MQYFAMDDCAKYKVEIRSGTGIKSIENFTVMSVGKLLVALGVTIGMQLNDSTTNDPKTS